MIRWRPSQELVVVVTYTVGLYMTVVDNTIIYTALPSLARGFHVSLDSAQWVTLSYLPCCSAPGRLLAGPGRPAWWRWAPRSARRPARCSAAC